MKVNPDKIYLPQQPSVKGYPGPVTYREVSPHPALSHSVYCYWELKSDQPLDHSFDYRVVADGCTDIFYETRQPAMLFIMGFTDHFTSFSTGREFHYTGIRFLPGGMASLLRHSAAELAGHYILLELVFPGLYRDLKELTQRYGTLETLVPRLDRCLLKFAAMSSGPDPRFLEAYYSLLRSGGHIRLEKELGTAVSPRHLRRLFQQYIGTTPKAFQKVVRFQRFLWEMNSGDRDTKAYYELGYYDQNHFIKDFKKMYGLTPSLVYP